MYLWKIDEILKSIIFFLVYKTFEDLQDALVKGEVEGSQSSNQWKYYETLSIIHLAIVGPNNG